MSERTIPEGLDLITTADGLVIRRVWRSWKLIPLAAFAVVWDGFLIFWYSVALSSAKAPLVAVLFPILHVAVGFGITYYVIAAFMNKTDVVVSPTGVKITSGPAPWIGNKEVKMGDLCHIVVRERYMNKGARAFDIMYADQSRKERKLMGWISQSDQAEFIADTIREAIGVTAKV